MDIARSIESSRKDEYVKRFQWRLMAGASTGWGEENDQFIWGRGGTKEHWQRIQA